MSTFIVGDIIRICKYNNGIFKNVVISQGNGHIINLTNSEVFINWTFNNVNESADYTTTNDIIELSTFKLYGLDVQKKITDNDWIYKDGKHYFNNGYTTDYAFQKLREERDKKLDETDYIIREDYPNPIDSIKQEWYTYRQELRDLPATSNPQLDTNGQLINVSWSILPS